MLAGIDAEEYRQLVDYVRALSDELAAADRARRIGTTELALAETPEVATTESYHEVPTPAGAPVGSLVAIRL